MTNQYVAFYQLCYFLLYCPQFFPCKIFNPQMTPFKHQFCALLGPSSFHTYNFGLQGWTCTLVKAYHYSIWKMQLKSNYPGNLNWCHTET
jgi:hypothetical protein